MVSSIYFQVKNSEGAFLDKQTLKNTKEQRVLDEDLFCLAVGFEQANI